MGEGVGVKLAVGVGVTVVVGAGLGVSVWVGELDGVGDGSCGAGARQPLRVKTSKTAIRRIMNRIFIVFFLFRIA